MITYNIESTPVIQDIGIPINKFIENGFWFSLSPCSFDVLSDRGFYLLPYRRAFKHHNSFWHH